MEYKNVMDNPNNHKHEEYLEIIKKGFKEAIKDGKKLFSATVGGNELWELYLGSFPEEHRQHYNCRACRQFIERYGNLVTINEDGSTHSVMWSMDAPDFFKKVVGLMKATVENSRVSGVFISDEITLGKPDAGGWTHLSVQLPREMVNFDRLKNADQKMAELREEYAMLNRGLAEFPLPVAEQALAMIQSGTLSRADRCIGIAEWFVRVHQLRAEVKGSREKTNITWLVVGTAPTGFCHIKSSMIGTLLEDISNGLSAMAIKIRFDEKMNPSTYMRSQTAPTANAIMEAEKIVKKLGVENSLARRYATLEEVSAFWKPRAHVHTSFSNAQSVGSVFGNITPRDAMQAPAMTRDIPTSVMTWEKFKKTVLPTADSIEARVEDMNRLMALVTAQDPTAPNILQWDNTVSWYYHGGVDAEVKARVESAGGQYEDCDIRCSLIWDGYTDLDLHCKTPTGKHLCFREKRVDGGWLDIDMNGGSHRCSNPVENIRWSKGMARDGHYEFIVHNYAERGRGAGTPYKVELEVDGQIYTFDGKDLSDDGKVTVFSFDYVRGQRPVFQGATANTSNNGSWSVRSNEFVKVNAITTSPNLWSGDDKYNHLGQHIFFLLDGCRDLSDGCGRGFFNEMLKSELRQIRKTLEAFTANAPIERADQATACGLGFSYDNEWNLTLKVTSSGSKRFIKIDRWD